MGRERHVVLDALRGLALLGIALANFPEFGLWTFLSKEAQSLQSTEPKEPIIPFSYETSLFQIKPYAFMPVSVTDFTSCFSNMTNSIR